MLIISGRYEPSHRPKNAIFRCVISVYFFPFFIDHPVFAVLDIQGVREKTFFFGGVRPGTLLSD